MKRDLLVTLADKSHINPAKQLFSSVYWNAGWQGDYMLLAHEIPEQELKWFKDKGILIKECETIPHPENLYIWEHHSPVILSKFYLFNAEFKKWKNIVFLDGDIIVRASLGELTKIKGFAAPKTVSNCLKTEFRAVDKELYKKLQKEYPLKGDSFHPGLFAFNTDILEKETFSKLIKLFQLYGKLSIHGEGAMLNLLFYNNWARLSWVYNLYPRHIKHRCFIKPERLKGIIIHFVASYKPWDPKSPFYKEWQYNLERADFINLEKRPPPRKKWSKEEIESYVSYLSKIKRTFFILTSFIILIDKLIGQVGIFLKKHSPALYFKLKQLK